MERKEYHLSWGIVAEVVVCLQMTVHFIARYNKNIVLLRDETISRGETNWLAALKRSISRNEVSQSETHALYFK